MGVGALKYASRADTEAYPQLGIDFCYALGFVIYFLVVDFIFSTHVIYVHKYTYMSSHLTPYKPYPNDLTITLFQSKIIYMYYFERHFQNTFLTVLNDRENLTLLF